MSISGISPSVVSFPTLQAAPDQAPAGADPLPQGGSASDRGARAQRSGNPHDSGPAGQPQGHTLLATTKPYPLPGPPIGQERWRPFNPPTTTKPWPLPMPPVDGWPKPRPPLAGPGSPIYRPPSTGWPPKIEWPPIDLPKPTRPGCGCDEPPTRRPFEDTSEVRYTPFFGPTQTVLDTGRNGPDQVDITINSDGSSCVNVNGQRYSYSAEETRNLHVRVDGNDNVKITDNRSPISKALSPNPIDVFNYPR